MAKIVIDSADLLKIIDALEGAEEFLRRRDEMNAAVHMARGVRYSPLTTTVQIAHARAGQILRRGEKAPDA